MIFLLMFLYLAASSNAAVTLDSSSDSVCPGDTVVFTCATDTGELVWAVNNSKGIFNDFLTMDNTLSIFDLKLIDQNGNNFISTAAIDSVNIDHNGTAISCSDNSLPLNTTITSKETVVVGGLPPKPLNLTFCFIHSSVTISWVAPLDTPLCVHSYTVTVRNSCNSSQEMVYNTTDNRSSLNITDLTSDGEYSMTVAGRNGAGRLGQESEELDVLLDEKNLITNFTRETVLMETNTYGALLSWNYPQQSHYIIHHNVSLDQCPIKIDRPKLTLYGAQRGQTYFVEIVPLTGADCGQTFTFEIKIADTDDTIEQNCASNRKNDEKYSNTDLSFGHIASVLGSVVLMFVITCYFLLCVFTRLYVPTDKACDNHRGVNHCTSGDEVKDLDTPGYNIAGDPLSRLPEYDYVRHQ